VFFNSQLIFFVGKLGFVGLRRDGGAAQLREIF
jgi:hypothetical protein